MLWFEITGNLEKLTVSWHTNCHAFKFSFDLVMNKNDSITCNFQENSLTCIYHITEIQVSSNLTNLNISYHD